MVFCDGEPEEDSRFAPPIARESLNAWAAGCKEE
jgi:hypothetical protein